MAPTCRRCCRPGWASLLLLVLLLVLLIVLHHLLRCSRRGWQQGQACFRLRQQPNCCCHSCSIDARHTVDKRLLV
jgi:hypothetical protein